MSSPSFVTEDRVRPTWQCEGVSSAQGRRKIWILARPAARIQAFSHVPETDRRLGPERIARAPSDTRTRGARLQELSRVSLRHAPPRRARAVGGEIRCENPDHYERPDGGLDLRRPLRRRSRLPELFKPASKRADCAQTFGWRNVFMLR